MTTHLAEHTRLRRAAERHWGRRLRPREAVPGCTCPTCTGLPADHPARLPAWLRAVDWKYGGAA